MLTLTDQASIVIRALAERTDAPADAGLRIATPPNGDEGLVVSTAASPVQGDQVIESDGARVFLEQNAAMILEDQTLDARVDESGRVEFVLA